MYVCRGVCMYILYPLFVFIFCRTSIYVSIHLSYVSISYLNMYLCYLCIYVSTYLCIYVSMMMLMLMMFFHTAAVLLCGNDTRPNTRPRRKCDVTTACLHVEAPASIRGARRTGRRPQRERCYPQPPSARAQIRATAHTGRALPPHPDRRPRPTHPGFEHCPAGVRRPWMLAPPLNWNFFANGRMIILYVGNT